MVVAIQDMAPFEELERLRVEFLGMVSHEGRAPLTSIKGVTAPLKRPQGTGRNSRSLWFLTTNMVSRIVSYYVYISID